MNTAELNQRKQRVLEMAQQGVAVMEIVRQSGLSYGTASKVLREGAVTIPKRRGRKAGTGSALTAQQQGAVLAAMRTTPITAGVDGLVWTKQAVADVISAKLQITLAPRTIDKYLESWRLGRDGSLVHPAKRSTAAVRAWWEHNQDALCRDARAGQARILWLNRTVTLDGAGQWLTNIRYRSKYLQLLSAETSKGQRYWLVFPGQDNQQNETRFLENLQKHLRYKLFAIRTAGPIYHRSEVIHHVERSKGRIRLFPATG